MQAMTTLARLADGDVCRIDGVQAIAYDRLCHATAMPLRTRKLVNGATAKVAWMAHVDQTQTGYRDDRGSC